MYFLLIIICLSFLNNLLVFVCFFFFWGFFIFLVLEVLEVVDLLIFVKLCMECCLLFCYVEGFFIEMDIIFIFYVWLLVCWYFILYVCNFIFLCFMLFLIMFEKFDLLWCYYNVMFFIWYCMCDLLLEFDFSGIYCLCFIVYIFYFYKYFF